MRALTVSLNPFNLPESVTTQPVETRTVQFPEGLILESGERLAPLTLAYRTYGRLNRRRSNAVLVVHALTGSASVEQWWPELIGTGKALDPAEHFVICVNLLGSCYGSSGPYSTHPHRDGKYQADFPRLTVRDQVEAQIRLLNYLGINRVKSIIGPSLGGMIALEFGLLYPQRVSSLVLVATAAKHSAQAIALSEIQRNAIKLDVNYHGGFYEHSKAPVRGLALARQLAHVGYRSPQAFCEKFDRKISGSGRFDVLSYLDHQGEKFCARFDANSYIRLTECMNTHDVGRGRDTAASALKSMSLPILLLSFSSDQLYPVHEQAFIAQHARKAKQIIINTAEGHDGFLIEAENLNQHIEKFLKKIPQAIK